MEGAVGKGEATRALLGMVLMWIRQGLNRKQLGEFEKYLCTKGPSTKM